MPGTVLSNEIVATLGLFGDGSDGSADLDGTNTVAWASKSGSTYTMSEDVFMDDLIVRSGVILQTNNWRLFIKGLLTFDGGTIGNFSIDAAVGNTLGGARADPIIGTSGFGLGGSGGAQGGGGLGRVIITPPATRYNGLKSIYCFREMVLNHTRDNTGTFNHWFRGGGNGGTGGTGGAPGRGGGICVIVANMVHATANGGTVSAKGEDATAASSGAGHGGGGGGAVSVFAGEITGSLTVTVAGGAGGTGSPDGSPGSDGNYAVVKVR